MSNYLLIPDLEQLKKKSQLRKNNNFIVWPINAIVTSICRFPTNIRPEVRRIWESR